MSEVKTNKISSLASNNNITIDPDGTGKVAFSSDITMTSDDPTITMTDSSGTNDIATIQATSGALIVTARDGSADGEIIFKKTDGSATDETMRITSAGKLGIGTSSPASSLHVASDAADFVARFYNDGNSTNRLGIFVQTGTDDGSGTNIFFAAYDGDGSETGQLRSVSGTFQLTDTSDERLKQDIVDTTVSGLTSVNAMRIRDFAYRRNPTETIEAGFVAQELQTAFPSAVSYSESDDDKILSVSRERLVPVLVKAIQELSAKNDALEARITALEAE
jgi:hypothetical protein